MQDARRQVDGVARTESLLGQLVGRRAVQHQCIAGQHADGLFLLPVILQAQRMPGLDVDDLSDVFSLHGSEDQLVPPWLVLPAGTVNLGLRSMRGWIDGVLRAGHLASPDECRWPERPWPERPWPGRPWPGRPWPGRPWPGRPWPGRPWPGRPWPGRRWPGRRWPGRRWPGRRWPGRRWPGRRWPDPWA